MKKLVAISGCVGFSTAVISAFFKIAHFPGAGILIAVSAASLALFFIPSYAKYWYDKNK